MKSSRLGQGLVRLLSAPTADGFVLRVDLRLKWKQESTSIAAKVKEVGMAGEVSLAVADDDQIGEAAWIVLLDSSGNAVDRRTTSVGETA